MIYFDVKYFSVVCLSIRCLKLAVKTTVTRVGHFLAKKLNVCPSNIIFVCPTKTDLDFPHWEDEPEVQVNQKVQEQQSHKLVFETCLRYLSSALEHQPKHDSSIPYTIE